MKTLSEFYADVEKVVDRMRLKVHLHAHEFVLLSEFVAGLNRPSVRPYSETAVSLGYEYGQLQGIIVQFFLDKHESFAACTPVIEHLLERGWKQDTQEENASWGYREVAFKKTHTDQPLFWPTHKEWEPQTLTATIRMWPHPTSQICQKVEDGTEPKYKFVCQEA